MNENKEKVEGKVDSKSNTRFAIVFSYTVITENEGENTDDIVLKLLIKNK